MLTSTSGFTVVNGVGDGGTRLRSDCGMQHVALEPNVDLDLWYLNQAALRLEYNAQVTGAFSVRVWFHGMLDSYEQGVGVFARSATQWVAASVTTATPPGPAQLIGNLTAFTNAGAHTEYFTSPGVFPGGGGGSVMLSYDPAASGAFSTTVFDGNLADAGFFSTQQPTAGPQTVGLYVVSSAVQPGMPPGNEVWLERLDICGGGL
jgi:hypothetical protein